MLFLHRKLHILKNIIKKMFRTCSKCGWWNHWSKKNVIIQRRIIVLATWKVQKHIYEVNVWENNHTNPRYYSVSLWLCFHAYIQYFPVWKHILFHCLIFSLEIARLFLLLICLIFVGPLCWENQNVREIKLESSLKDVCISSSSGWHSVVYTLFTGTKDSLRDHFCEVSKNYIDTMFQRLYYVLQKWFSVLLDRRLQP